MFTALKTNAWAYPALESVHIVGIALLLGNLVALEMRVFGRAAALPVEALARLSLGLALCGFALAGTTGLLMFATQPFELLANQAFILKMTLLAVAGCNAAWFHSRESLHKLDATARVQMLVSTAIWLAVGVLRPLDRLLNAPRKGDATCPGIAVHSLSRSPRPHRRWAPCEAGPITAGAVSTRTGRSTSKARSLSSKWQNPHAELMLDMPAGLKLPADLKARALPAQSAPVDGPGLLAKASLPERSDRRWELELAPLTRMEAWKVAEIKSGAMVSAVGFTTRTSRARP